MNAKEVRAAKADIRSTAYKGQEFMFKGVMDATGLDRADARAAVTGNMDVQKQKRAIDAAADNARMQEAGANARAATANNRAVISDANADARQRQASAATLIKTSQVTISNMLATPEERLEAQADSKAAKAVLRELGGMIGSQQARDDVAKYLNPTKK